MANALARPASEAKLVIDAVAASPNGLAVMTAIEAACQTRSEIAAASSGHGARTGYLGELQRDLDSDMSSIDRLVKVAARSGHILGPAERLVRAFEQDPLYAIHAGKERLRQQRIAARPSPEMAVGRQTSRGLE
jgi:hypothetical protein